MHERRKELNQQGAKYGRSAAHCIIPNQMLEWYSPMIVVSFYDIHDVDNTSVALHSSAAQHLDAIESQVMVQLDSGGSIEDIFDRDMTELCKFNREWSGQAGIQLAPFFQVMADNWLLFSLYYATCMLEGCYGLSPFRDPLIPSAGTRNPCQVRKK